MTDQQTTNTIQIAMNIDFAQALNNGNCACGFEDGKAWVCDDNSNELITVGDFTVAQTNAGPDVRVDMGAQNEVVLMGFTANMVPTVPVAATYHSGPMLDNPLSGTWVGVGAPPPEPEPEFEPPVLVRCMCGNALGLFLPEGDHSGVYMKCFACGETVKINNAELCAPDEYGEHGVLTATPDRIS
jgi:hypothetical protein